MKRIPGTHFLVTSGFSEGSGLKLVDRKFRRLNFWFQARPEQLSPDLQRYPDCATPPDPEVFNARGLSLRRTGRRSARLHVVNHGGREAVEIFAIRWNSASSEPSIAWQGCLLMPQGHVGNAVATYRDGTVLVSVLTRPGTSITDFERGMATGGVYERPPGARYFSLIKGSELPGNNGLETSADDQHFYAVAFGLRAVAIFARGSKSGPLALVPAPGFMPDNIHRDGKTLIAAGMNSIEPACGGARQIINGVADRMLCPRGWKVAEFNPRHRRFSVLAEGKATPSFNGVSQAVVADGMLWLGSYQADRIAYRPLRAR